VAIRVQIHPEVVHAYRKYADFKDGDVYRLYVRTAGPGTGGLFYAIDKSRQEDITDEDVVFAVEGITFYIMPGDFWYFNGGTLSYNRLLGEYGFEFKNPGLA
jgi:iron-sulfur cluster assembly protein